MLLIEGVGGVMVPLDERRTVLDWIAALRLPAIPRRGKRSRHVSHALTALRRSQPARDRGPGGERDEESTVALDETPRRSRGLPPLPFWRRLGYASRDPAMNSARSRILVRGDMMRIAIIGQQAFGKAVLERFWSGATTSPGFSCRPRRRARGPTAEAAALRRKA